MGGRSIMGGITVGGPRSGTYGWRLGIYDFGSEYSCISVVSVVIGVVLEGPAGLHGDDDTDFVS